MGNFFSKGPDYFGMLQNGIRISGKAAKTLQEAFAGEQIDEEKIKALRAIEHEGDKHVHESAKLIADAFIMPIERPDMMNLLAVIEALTDSIDDIGNQVYMMHIVHKDATSGKFVGLLVSACKELCTMMGVFKDFKTKQDQLHTISIRVNHIEEEGDALFISAMRDLFDPAQKMDTIDVIRCEHLYQTMEDAMDSCEDVADVVSHIMITNT